MRLDIVVELEQPHMQQSNVTMVRTQLSNVKVKHSYKLKYHHKLALNIQSDY